MNKSEIAKSLKRYLKKKGSYSLALLVGFLISGTISLGDVITTQELSRDNTNILRKISKIKNEIKQKIKENQKKISKETVTFDTLVEEWDFFGKPILQNTQFIFSYDKINSGSLKDKTKEAFKETIDAYINLDAKNSSDIALNKIVAGIGPIYDFNTFSETIEISANVVPIVPKIPVINKEISINIDTPKIGGILLPNLPNFNIPPALTVNGITIGAVIAPTFAAPTITAAESVASIDVTPPKILPPTVTGDKVVNIGKPVAPSGFIPSQIVPSVLPEVPADITLELKTTGSFGYTDTSFMTLTDDVWFWNPWATSSPKNPTGLISQAIIVDGDFKFKVSGKRNNDPFDAEVEGYSASISEVYTNGPAPITNITYAKLVANPGSAIYRVIGSDYSSFGSDTTVVIDAATRGTSGEKRPFIYFSSAGQESREEIEDIKSAVLSEKEKAKTLVNKYKGELEYKGYQMLTLKGAIAITGNTMLGVAVKDAAVTGKISNQIVLHTGKTVIRGNNNAVFGFSTYNSRPSNSSLGLITNYEDGSIEISGDRNIVIQIENTNNKTIKHFENNGVIDIKSGDGNAVYLARSGANSGYLDLQSPITISSIGTGNVGVYQTNEIGSSNPTSNLINPNSVIKVDITGATGTGNIGFIGQVDGQSIARNEFNITGGTGNIGSVSKKGDLTLNELTVNLIGGTENIALLNENGDLIANGNINMSGVGNIGLLSRSTGNLTQTGDITLTGDKGIAVYLGELRGYPVVDLGSINQIGNININGGKENTVVFIGQNLNEKGNVTVGKVTVTGTKDSILFYAKSGATITVGELNATIQVDQKDSGAAFVTGVGSKILMNKTVRDNTKANISVTGGVVTGTHLGFGLMVDKGGKISAQFNNIEVIDGSTGIGAVGTGSHIDFTGGKLKYTGNGLAVYSDGVGTIDLSGATVELLGNSTAFVWDMGLTTPFPIKFDSKSIIEVGSNDVLIFNLKDAPRLDTETLEEDILEGAGIPSLEGIIKVKPGITGYKTAAVDGGEITVGSLDKTGTGTPGESEEQFDGNFYYNRFLGQRLVATTKVGSTISATLTSIEAGKYNNQVVGFEMNSSTGATDNKKAGIHLMGSTVIADRIDAGAGAMGLFINYGTVNIGSGSIIEVEKGNNVVNGGGVGVYSVNGSDVTVAANGRINVSGAGAFGILGMAYRENTTENAIVDEFGAAAIGQGKIDISNSGIITLTGIGSIGIYAYNNNETTTDLIRNSIVYNKVGGKIKVGNSGVIGGQDVASVGIYSEKTTVSNLGIIEVGDGGVGIYGINDSTISDLGTINLGSDGIGVLIDETSKITASDTMILGTTAGNIPEISGKIGILYKGTKTATPQTIALSIDSSKVDGAIAIYIEDAVNTNVISTGKLEVGINGVGLYSKNSVVENKAIGSNIIDLGSKTGSVGMYLQSDVGKTGSITNSSIINIGADTQLAMLGTGLGSTIINTGTINLKSSGSTGIYGGDKAKVELSGNGIQFTATKSIGVFVKDATVNISGTVTHDSINANENILIYGENGSEIYNIGGLTVDGTIASGNSKSIGIYLNGVTTIGEVETNISNTYEGTGTLYVKNAAIGVYSKVDNSLDFAVGLSADGTGTIGAYIEGAATLRGNITSDNGAIGVYGKEGVINLDVATTTTVKTTGGSTGFYLEDGAYLTGNLSVVGEKNGIGTYYSRSEASTEDMIVTSTGNMTIKNTETTGGNIVGIFVSGSTLKNTSTVINNGKITGVGSNNIVATMAKNGILNIGEIITIDGKDSVGAFASDGGIITNNSIIRATNTSASTTDTTIGMIAASAVVDRAAIIENGLLGTITANGTNDLGMYLGATVGNNEAKNSGIINVKDGIAVYNDGSSVAINSGSNKFTNTGIINVNGTGVGLYLTNSKNGTITNAGTINLNAANGKGIYANNSVIDFDVTISGVEKGIGVYASGTTNFLDNKITVADGQIGIYIDSTDVNLDTATVITGNNGATQNSMGIYLQMTTDSYTMDGTNIIVGNGVGMYLGNNATQGAVLDFAGAITTTGGKGIYVSKLSTLNIKTATLNINGGIGIYVEEGGIANLGVNDILTIGLNETNGMAAIGIYAVAGATINLGNNIIVEGAGTLAIAINANLNSNSTLNVGKNSQGLLGGYSGLTGTYSITNGTSGVINIKEGGIGLVAQDNDSSNPSLTAADISAVNAGTLNVDGHTINLTPTGEVRAESIGIYSEVAEVQNTGTIAVTGDGGIGIYYNGKISSPKDINSNIINLNGTNEIGMYLTGNIGNVINGSLTSMTADNIGIFIADIPSAVPTPTLNVGNISLGEKSIGLMLNNVNIDIVSGGNIVIGNGASISNSSIGIYAENSTLTGVFSGAVSVGKNGIAYYMENSTANIDFQNITLGTEGTYLYAKNTTPNMNTVTVTGNLTVTNGQTGIVLENTNVNISGLNNFTVEKGGIGLVLKGIATTGSTPVITINSGSEDNYSIGTYYDAISRIISLVDVIATNQIGDYTISHVLDKTSATIDTITLGAGSLIGTKGNNQIGVMLKTDSTLTVGMTGSTTDTIKITGNNNIGIYAGAEEGVSSNIVTVHGNIKVGVSGNGSSEDPNKLSSIGVYVKNGTYTGNDGTLTIGNNSIGIYGEQLTGTVSQGEITVGDSALGIYALSGLTGVEITQTGGLVAGNAGSIGIYGTDVDRSGNISGGATKITVTGGTDDRVGTGTSIGILSQGAGNVTYSGAMTIVDSPSKGSIGIYKDGVGTITATGTINVGAAGYGIYSINGKNSLSTTPSSDINNNTNMILGEASIGIYSKGKATIVNSGDIVIGTTKDHNDVDYVNSIGIYSVGGIVENSGDITVDKDRSIGIYVSGGTLKNSGKIDVKGSGIGIIISDSTAENDGVITVGEKGTDSVRESIGISIQNNAIFTNNKFGKIIINAGIGINIEESGGTFINNGELTIGEGAIGIYEEGNGSDVKIGAVKINSDGTVTIGGNYVGIGGTLDAAADIVLNGPWIDGTTSTGKPLFSGNTVSGEVNLLPGFISGTPNTTLEGFFDNFVGAHSMPNGITVITSPLYVAKKVGNDLVVVKRPYADLSVGDQFDELENGLDNLRDIANGNKNDSDILVNLDKYLNGFRGDEFAVETGKAIAETRGDIYGTIQGRMQNINNSFDNSFDELVNSYNPSKESDKFSVIYTSGDFKDPTIGVSDYDYDVKGLLYMHEEETLTYGTKYGYTLGFAGSEFKFDDDAAGSSGSSEDVYSLRVGAHREQKLGKTKFTWLTRGELAYNYHDTDRKMQLGPDNYDNKADYSSYGVSFKKIGRASCRERVLRLV